MGQYYKPVSLTAKQFVHPHDNGNGLKLTEHSWKKNNIMLSIMGALAKDGNWYKNRIVWAGDYADKDLFLTEDEINNYSNWLINYKPDYVAQYGSHPNVYKMCFRPNEIQPIGAFHLVSFEVPKKTNRFIVNHSKKLYVDMSKCPNNHGWVVHPLSLLISIGNGNGCGDYYSDAGSEFIGTWAGDVISTEPKIKTKEFKEFVEIIPNFIQ